jgi:hypothetical protein
VFQFCLGPFIKLTLDKPATGRVFYSKCASLATLSSSKLDTDKGQHATKPQRAHSAWLETATVSSKASTLACSRTHAQLCLHNLLLVRSNDEQSRLRENNGYRYNVAPALCGRSPCQAKKSPPLKSKDEAPNYNATTDDALWPDPLILIGRASIKSE